jgi:hypothetical protein
MPPLSARTRPHRQRYSCDAYEKLERVAQLERAYAQAERDAEWDLTPEERAAITDLSQDLPSIWGADTTSNQEASSYCA